MSHDATGNRADLIKIGTWYAPQLSYLLIAGKGNGAIRTGRNVKYTNNPTTNQLFLHGVDLTSPAECGYIIGTRNKERS